MELIFQKLRPPLPALILAIAFFLGHVAGFYQSVLNIGSGESVALTILMLTALFWITETVPLYVTSLAVLARSVLWLLPELQELGKPAHKDDFLKAFFGDITLLFMGGFVLSSLLNKYGLARRIANWMIQRTGSAPERVLLGLIAISALLSMWMSNTATAAMMFAIVAPLILQIPAGSTFTKAIALAIPFACNIGGLGTPIGTPPNAIAMEYLNRAGIEVSFSKWMVVSIPILLILLAALWQLLLRLFPPGEIKITIEEDPNSAVDFTVRQKIVMVVFALTIIGWLTGGLTGLSTGFVGLLCIIFSFGAGLLNTVDFRNISWDILFMLGGGLCLGVVLNKSGLTDTIAHAIPMDQGFIFVFGVLLVMAAGMTTVMSNTATANLLIPVAVSLPGNELIFSIAIAIMCSTSMALPVSTPPNAIAFGSGLLQSKDMLIAGLILTILSLIATSLASIFYIPLFF